MEPVQLNLTIGKNILWSPDKQCVDWCTVQQVVHSHNLETSIVLLAAAAYVLMNAYYILKGTRHKDLGEVLLYLSKLLLLSFLGLYVLIYIMHAIW